LINDLNKKKKRRSHYIDTTHGYSVDGSRKRYALRHFVSFIFTAN